MRNFSKHFQNFFFFTPIFGVQFFLVLTGRFANFTVNLLTLLPEDASSIALSRQQVILPF